METTEKVLDFGDDRENTVSGGISLEPINSELQGRGKKGGVLTCTGKPPGINPHSDDL